MTAALGTWPEHMICGAGLVQRCKGRYELLRHGASLVGRAPRLTFDQADQPQEYERNMRNRAAVLDTLTCSLAALLNLSVLKANQVIEFDG